MICRRRPPIALIALALGLAGCVGDDGTNAVDAPTVGDPAVVRLLGEADAAMLQGTLADAGRKLDEARMIAPEDPDLWVAIARLRFRGGEHLTALEAVDRALARSPHHAPALLMRALMVRDAHGPAEALPWFEAALAVDPENADLWAEYAATLGDSGRGRAMLRAVRKLAKIAPNDARVFYQQAVLAARGGNPALARSLLERSEMAVRGVPAAMMLDAVISLDQGNFDSAAATLKALSARQPANARVRELLVRALFAGGRDVELVARFAAEAQRPEASPYLTMLVARALERLGARASAAPLLARAYGGALRAPAVLAAHPGLPQPTAAMRLAASAGSWGGALARAQDLRVRFPASSDVATLAGDAALGAGDIGGAVETYAQSARLRRPWPLSRKVVFALRSAGDADAADMLLVQHVAGEPTAITAIFELSQAQAARDEWAQAALLLDHAIRLGGGHDPALLTLRIKAAHALSKPEQARGFAMLLAEIQPRALAQQ